MKKMLTKVFGPGCSRSRYHYLEITNTDVYRIVNRLWPLCYSKSSMPQNKLIGKELCLEVLAEYQLEWEIDWTVYATKTNATQWAKHARTLARYEGMRDTLLQEAGIGARSNVHYDRMPPTRSGHGERIHVLDMIGQSSYASSFSPCWINWLTLQVGDLLHPLEENPIYRDIKMSSSLCYRRTQ
jgi:hypothetical protein